MRCWHPGQQFGHAIAAVLFGDADPGGRLPVTFPATPGQGPMTRAEQCPGVGGDALCDEGTFVGYRWYDQHPQQPLFPFGHGLSYSTFHYADPRLQQSAAGERASTTVTFDLTLDDLAAFDENSREWVVHAGPYGILIGRSSRDLPVRADIFACGAS